MATRHGPGKARNPTHERETTAAGQSWMAHCEPCGKRAYREKAHAKRAIRAIRERGMRAYRCDHGPGWHIGHLPMAVRAGVRTRDEHRALKTTADL